MNPFVDAGVKAAREAGRVMVRYIDRIDQLKVEQKGRNDLVSQVDRITEETIIEVIHERFPQHRIHGEESGEVAAKAPPSAAEKDDYLWLIDPIDGTANYLNGIPHYCSSLALQKNGVTEHGVIFDPIKDELFAASKGAGAMLNNRRIRCSRTRSLKGAIVNTGFPNRDLGQLDEWLRIYRALLPKVRDTRQSGSAALDLAYLAAGRCSILFQADLASWDIAAGMLMVREAGGFVSDYQGQQNSLENGQIIAANGELFNDFLAIVKQKRNP